MKTPYDIYFYEAFAEERTAMGVQGDAVFQSADNPNDVTAWHDFETLEASLVPLIEVFLNNFLLDLHGGFELGKISLTLLIVDTGDDVSSEVDCLFQQLWRHVKQVTEP